MHVVFILTRSDQFSGPQVHLRDLTLALLKRGHEVTVLTGGEGVFTEELDRLGIRRRSLRHMIAPIHPVRDTLGWIEVCRELRRLRPELLSTHSSKAGVVGRLAALPLGIPVLHTAHGWAFTRDVASPIRRLYLEVERVSVRFAAHVITVSEFDRSVALAADVAPPTRMTTVHNGVVDIQARLRAEPGGEPPRLIMVARLEKQKDHPTLLRALARLSDRPWTLEVVGTGPLEAELERLARQLGLEDRVTFLGHRMDVAGRLAAAQIFVLASRWEGFPRSILEAMRAGLPVVATDVAGVSEAVVDRATGFVVERGNVHMLSERIERLLTERELRTRMGHAGRERYEQFFTHERLVEETLEVYRKITVAKET